MYVCECVNTVLTWACRLNPNFNTVIWRKILRHVDISPKPDIILPACKLGLLLMLIYYK